MKAVKLTFTDAQWKLILRHSEAEQESDAALVRDLIARYFEARDIHWPEDLTPVGGYRGGGRPKKTPR